MRADIHFGPERDEAPRQWSATLVQRLTFDQLNYVACDTRPDHTFVDLSTFVQGSKVGRSHGRNDQLTAINAQGGQHVR